MRSGRPLPSPLTARVTRIERDAFRRLCLIRNSNPNRELCRIVREHLASAPELRSDTRGEQDMLQIQPGTPSYALGALPTKEGKSPVERQQIEDRIREKDAASRSAVRNNKPGFR